MFYSKESHLRRGREGELVVSGIWAGDPSYSNEFGDLVWVCDKPETMFEPYDCYLEKYPKIHIDCKNPCINQALLERSGAHIWFNQNNVDRGRCHIEEGSGDGEIIYLKIIENEQGGYDKLATTNTEARNAEIHRFPYKTKGSNQPVYAVKREHFRDFKELLREVKKRIYGC